MIPRGMIFETWLHRIEHNAQIRKEKTGKYQLLN